MKITLKNDFHDTSAVVVLKRPMGTWCYVVKAPAWTRAMRKLCGMADCSCGGLRGKQDWGNLVLHIDESGNAFFLPGIAVQADDA